MHNVIEVKDNKVIGIIGKYVQKVMDLPTRYR